MREVEVLPDLSRPCALVPTMGALHAGHQSLIRRARELADEVVVSVFVNPLQFEDREDLARYPSAPKQDNQLAMQAGATILWKPSYESIYPGEIKTLSSGEIGNRFEGIHRPGHFDGVLTVVNRLFELSRPKYAIFGEKDFQQLFLIKQMAAKLDSEINIITAPTIRDSSGLALSSRNIRLSQQALKDALVISRTLRAASNESSIKDARQALMQVESEASFTLDYAEIIDEESFQVADESSVKTRAIIAGWIEGVRLIDNMAMQKSLVRV
ncbi:MAG: pantoate--beta-alanine ligase [Actinobacteria bacterium]|nr:pantoate--beta-alanine ligase [Actinomycetota bacterium]